MGNDTIDFAARFGGVARELSIPIGRIAAIYARENGHGMSFEIEPNATPWEASGEAAAQPAPEPPSPAPGGGKPTLRVVK